MLRRLVGPLCIAALLVSCDNASSSSAEPTAASPTPSPSAAPEEGQPEGVEPSRSEPPKDVVASVESVTLNGPSDESSTSEVEPTAPATEPEALPAGSPAKQGAKKKPDLSLPKPVYGSVDDSCGKDPGVGETLKPFKLKMLDGTPIGHRSYRNRVLLVNFWGTWCKPCLKELPEFDRLYRRYRKYGMTLVAIATDDDPEPVESFVEKRKIAAKIVLGGEEYAEKYNSPQFPFTFVVDTSGTILGSYRGYRSECMGKLEADLRRGLNARNGIK